MLLWVLLCISQSHAQFCDKESCPQYASFPQDKNGRLRPDALFSDNHDEVHNSELRLVFGKVPEWLDGTLYRVGPGIYEYGNRKVTNMVDALSKVTRWSIRKDKPAVFSTALLRSSMFNRTIESGNLIPMRHLGVMVPPLTAFEIAKITLYDDLPDNNNIAVWELGSNGATITGESLIYVDLDYSTLSFQRKYIPDASDGHWSVKEILSASHFARHPGTGDSINYKLTIPLDKGYFSGSTSPEYRLYRYHEDSNGRIFADLIGKFPIDMDGFRVIHSLGSTPNYVVVPRFSLVVKPNHLADSSKNIILDKTAPTIIDIIAIADGKHTAFTFDPHESQHILNTFERKNDKGEVEIVVDYPTIADVENAYTGECIFELLNVNRLKNPSFSYRNHWKSYTEIKFRRFILNMDTGESSVYEFPQMWIPQVLQVEFPYINDAYRGLPYCYVYLQTWNHDANHAMGIMKVNLCEETSIGWHEINKFPAEPIFVAAPNASDEDEGVILSPVYDAAANTSSIYIWNAKNLQVLAVLESEINVPFTLHGIWINGV